jgi:hypothetical protein
MKGILILVFYSSYLLAMIIFHPGIDIGLICFPGFNPAFFCHDSISKADQLPDALITEK